MFHTYHSLPIPGNICLWILHGRQFPDHLAMWCGGIRVSRRGMEWTPAGHISICISLAIDWYHPTNTPVILDATSWTNVIITDRRDVVLYWLLHTYIYLSIYAWPTASIDIYYVLTPKRRQSIDYIRLPNQYQAHICITYWKFSMTLYIYIYILPCCLS